jgi:hypothetical protein
LQENGANLTLPLPSWSPLDRRRPAFAQRDAACYVAPSSS